MDLPAEPSFYALLNCVPASTTEQITAEYRRLALAYHPDKRRTGGGDGTEDGAEAAAFRAVQEAYDCLRDPEERRLYDVFLATGLRVPWRTWRAHVAERDHPVTHWYNPPEPSNRLAAAPPPEPTATEATSHAAAPALGERRVRTVEERWAEHRASDRLYSQFRNYEL